MSPARAYREGIAAATASSPTTPTGTSAEGGQPAFLTDDRPMTPAREHRIAHVVADLSTPGDVLDAGGAGVDIVAATAAMRLTHDLRRLKAIHSIEKKVDAKREMIGEYQPWCDAILVSGNANVRGVGSEVLPTILVWAIDINDWPRALELADHVIGCDIALPSRYQRTAAALLVENVSEEANKTQNANTAFPLEVLEHVEQLTAEHDMHDQIRAKLMKAIGIELQRVAETVAGAEAVIAAAERALVPLRRAQALDQRVGVKDRVKKLEKTIAAATREVDAAQAAAAKEAERVAAEEAERVAAEEAGRVAAEEAGRVAAEEAEHVAAEEAERVAAEEAERVAAEEAERVAAEATETERADVQSAD